MQTEVFNPPIDTYAARLTRLASKIEQVFGARVAQDVVNLVRSAERTGSVEGKQVLEKLQGALEAQSSDIAAFSKTMDVIRETLLSSSAGEEFQQLFSEATGVDQAAKRYLLETVPTLEDTEVMNINGRDVVVYHEPSDFIVALRALRPTSSLSFNKINFPLFSATHSQQLCFMDLNGVLHGFSKDYKSDEKYDEEVIPLFDQLDELKIKDGDGIAQVSKGGEIYLKFMTDAPDKQVRRENTVSNWIGAVTEAIKNLNQQDKSGITLSSFVDGDKTIVDLKISHTHYSTVIQAGDKYSFADLTAILPESIQKHSMNESMDWLKTFYLVD